MLDEFKKFIFKGDVVALATGVLIGAAFGKIVEAFTIGFVNPLLGKIVGTPKFDLQVAGFDLGLILTAMFMFLITAAVIFFFIVKPANAVMARMTRAEAAAPPVPGADVVLLTEIRDLLKK